MTHVPTSRSRAPFVVLLAVLAALAATLLGPASPASAVTKLTDAQAASQLSAVRHHPHVERRLHQPRRQHVHVVRADQPVDRLAASRPTSRVSGCAVNITGGTEVGHASGTYSHYNGYKVDIARSTCNDNYITSHYAYIGLRGDGYPQYQAASGNVYVNEGNHWDITYYTLRLLTPRWLRRSRSDRLETR